MMYDVIITQSAEAEITEIGLYINEELQTPETAVSLLSEIRERVLKLRRMPKRFPVASDENLARRGIRLMSVKNYIVFYIVNDEALTVNILSVLYNRRDWVHLMSGKSNNRGERK